MREAGIDLANAISAYEFALKRDTPAKTWWNASLDRAPIYRALRIPAETLYAAYAVHPFRLVRNESDQWRILAAHPAPAILDEPDADWLGIETVIEWDPVTDKARVLGDTADQIVGSFRDDADELHASPRTFFQGWAARRAQFAARRQALKAHFTVPPREADETPGALIVGNPDKVRWPRFGLPQTLNCVGVNPADVNRSILRQANLPRAVPAPSSLKVVA